MNSHSTLISALLLIIAACNGSPDASADDCSQVQIGDIRTRVYLADGDRPFRGIVTTCFAAAATPFART